MPFISPNIPNLLQSRPHEKLRYKAMHVKLNYKFVFLRQMNTLILSRFSLK